MGRAMADTVKDVMVDALEHARTEVLAGGEYMRMIYAHGADGRRTLIAAPCEGEDDGLIKYLKMLFIAQDITSYAMVSEVWISERPAYSAENGSLPQHDPERKEAITGIAAQRTLVGEASNEWIEKRSVARCWITRNPTAVGPIVWEPDSTKLDGRWFRLLPPKWFPPIPNNIRAELQKMLDDPSGPIKKLPL